MLNKPFAKKDGAKVLLATAIAFALIFGLATNGLKLRDKPPSWKITGERYGVDWQFRFGRSTPANFGIACSGMCETSRWQRNNLGPFYYERVLKATYPAFLKEGEKAPRPALFAELD